MANKRLWLSTLYFMLADLLGMTTSNVALNKPTWQSSTIASGRPSRAVDGSNASSYADGSCTHTNIQTMPWWRVELLESKLIWLVKITNRRDCCWGRLRNLQIRIGNSSSGAHQNPLCAYSVPALGRGETKDILCSKPMRGKYVYVTLMSRDYLTLCEVELFAVTGLKSQTHPFYLTDNIAKNKTAQQSSTLLSYTKGNVPMGFASQAVDGNLNADFLAASCTRTKVQVNPWWMVDLQDRHLVRKVILTNRGDKFPERLRHIEIRVGDRGGGHKISNAITFQITGCQYIAGEIGKGVSLEVNCTTPRRGRFVYVSIRGKGQLTLCEVQVFAEKGASLRWKKGKTCHRKSGGNQYWMGGAFGGPFIVLFCIICNRRKRGNAKATPAAAPSRTPPHPAPAASSAPPPLAAAVTSSHANRTEATDSTQEQRTRVIENGHSQDNYEQPSIAFIPPPDTPPPRYEDISQWVAYNDASESAARTVIYNPYAPPLYNSLDVLNLPGNVTDQNRDRDG